MSSWNSQYPAWLRNHSKLERSEMELIVLSQAWPLVQEVVLQKATGIADCGRFQIKGLALFLLLGENTNSPQFVSVDKITCQVVSSLKMKNDSGALFKILSLVSLWASQKLTRIHFFFFALAVFWYRVTGHYPELESNVGWVDSIALRGDWIICAHFHNLSS